MWEVVILNEIMLELEKTAKLLSRSDNRNRGSKYRGGGGIVHSFAGICSRTRGSDELISYTQSNAKARERWGKCDVVIINKVSMMSRDLFERLEIIARAMKKSN